MGRKPTINADRIEALTSEGIGATAIAQDLKVGPASVYRLMKGSGVDKSEPYAYGKVFTHRSQE